MSVRGGSYTVADLLSEPELGLTLASGDEERLARPVVGAHAIEGLDLENLLVPDWVVLTSGRSLSSKADQRAMIEQLDEGKVAALGFGLSAVHPKLPPAIVEAAGKFGIPVFSVPEGTEFREIVSRVHSNVASEEYRSYGRLPALLQFLLDALQQESPRETLINRLGEFLGASVALIDREKNVEVASDPIEWDSILEEAEIESTTTPVQTDDYHGVLRPVGLRGALVIVVPRTRNLHPLTRSAVKAAAPLVTTIEDMERAAQSHTEAVRRTTMELLLDAQTPFELRESETRTEAAGLSLPDGAHALAMQLMPGDLGTVDIEEALLRVENGLLDAGVPFFATVRREMACLLLPAPVDDEVIGTLLDAHPSLRIGVGRQINGADAVLHSWADAKLCLAKEAEGKDALARVMRYDDLDLDMVLINELPLERLRPKIQRWLEPLQANELVYETLVVYFQNDFDVARTAKAMNLHHNSVRYRLLRAEEVIGAPLRSAATIVSLHIALRVEADREPATDQSERTGD
jgi:hypothetical protein